MSGVVAWLTGLPSAGKSTLAREVVADLAARGVRAIVLDGDAVRAALVPEPGYDDAARAAFYETLARLAAMIAAQGGVVVVAATAHRRAFRDRARALAPAFVEVFVDTPAGVCRQRDAKQLYARDPATLPGAGAAYEPPLSPEVVVRPDDAARIGAVASAIERAARAATAAP